MELQKQILLFLSSIQNSFFDASFQAITMIGESTFVVCVICFIFWNINKKKGMTICMCMLTNVQAMGLIKAIVRFPRPWTMIEGLNTVRQSTATGYSFPSGHTTNASSSLTAIAIAFKKRWLSITCAILIVLVGFSRLYLCVHWPMDVACGLILGCGGTFLLFDIYSKILEDKERGKLFFIISAIVTTIAWIVIALLLFAEKIDSTAFSDFGKNIATFSGAVLGLIWERKVFDYSVEEGHWKRKLLRFALGGLGCLIILPLSKLGLKAIGFYNPITATARYFLATLWASGIYPILGGKLGLFVRAQQTDISASGNK